MRYKYYIENKCRQHNQSQILLDIVIAVRIFDMIVLKQSSPKIGIPYIIIALILKLVVYKKFQVYIKEKKKSGLSLPREDELIKDILTDKELSTVDKDNVKIYLSYKIDTYFKDLELLYFKWEGSNQLTCRGKWLTEYILL